MCLGGMLAGRRIVLVERNLPERLSYFRLLDSSYFWLGINISILNVIVLLDERVKPIFYLVLRSSR